MSLGIGAALHMLGGGSQVDPKELIGRTVTAAWIGGDELLFTLDGTDSYRLYDNGQSCCERRYTTCDDKPEDLVGGKLVNIEVKEVKAVEAEYDSHEQAFVEIRTDKAFITIVTHNEHNGYYGGFGLTIEKA